MVWTFIHVKFLQMFSLCAVVKELVKENLAWILAASSAH